MSNTQILQEALLFEGRQLLKETCNGLTASQRTVVEGIVREFQPLVEATLSTSQIAKLFRATEQRATDPKSNTAAQPTDGDANQSTAEPTSSAPSASTLQQVSKVLNNAKQWVQNTTPVRDFDDRFDRLKQSIVVKLGADSKVVRWAQQFGDYARKNPGKTAVVLGLLTAVASIAGGPAGGAIAGQILRGSVELLKGEKASTAIGRGVKTAVLGYVAGAVADKLGSWLSGLRASVVPFNDGTVELSFSGRQHSTTSFGTGSQGFDLQNVRLLRADAELANKLTQAVNAGRVDAFDQLYQFAKKVGSDQYREQLDKLGASAHRAALNNDSLFKALEGVRKAVTAAAQGATTAATAAPRRESVEHGRVNILTEAYTQTMFVMLSEGIWDKLKAAGSRVRQQFTPTKPEPAPVSYQALVTAWMRAGKPTDSADVMDVLLDAGVPKELATAVYDELGIRVSGSLEGDEDAVKSEAEQLFDEILSQPKEVQLAVFNRLSTVFNKQTTTPTAKRPASKIGRVPTRLAV